MPNKANRHEHSRFTMHYRVFNISIPAWADIVTAPIQQDDMWMMRAYIHDAITDESKQLTRQQVTYNWTDGSRPDGSKFSMHAVSNSLLVDAPNTSGASLAADIGLALTLRSMHYLQQHRHDPEWTAQRRMHLRILQLHKIRSDSRGQIFASISIVDTAPYQMRQQMR